MNIPEEAVEAAAEARYANYREDMSDFGMNIPEKFSDAPGITRRTFLDECAAELEAAAPFIAAQVLREVADAEQKASEEFARSLDMYDEDDPIPAAVMVERLRERADELEAGK